MPEPVRRHPFALAWDEWSESPEGKRCREDSAAGHYLENRLSLAFQAGAQACEKLVLESIGWKTEEREAQR